MNKFNEIGHALNEWVLGHYPQKVDRIEVDAKTYGQLIFEMTANAVIKRLDAERCITTPDVLQKYREGSYNTLKMIYEKGLQSWQTITGDIVPVVVTNVDGFQIVGAEK